MMKIYLAADHAGFEHKEALKTFLEGKDYFVEDFGAFEYNSEDDYPDFIIPAAKAAAATPGSRAIIFGGSGQGEAIAANRIAGVRAATYYGGPREIISLSREHNDANVLSIGARFVSKEEFLEVVEIWLQTGFSTQEKYQRRINKVASLLE